MWAVFADSVLATWSMPSRVCSGKTSRGADCSRDQRSLGKFKQWILQLNKRCTKPWGLKTKQKNGHNKSFQLNLYLLFSSRLQILFYVLIGRHEAAPLWTILQSHMGIKKNAIIFYRTMSLGCTLGCTNEGMNNRGWVKTGGLDH